jgi:membrane protein
LPRLIGVLKTLRKTLLDADLSILAASLSYATVFSLIPILTIFLMISQWVGEYHGMIESLKSLVLNFFATGLKEDTLDGLKDSLIRINPQALGAAGFLGFLFSAIKIMYDFDKCLLKIWAVRKKHLFAKHLLVYVAILVCIPLGLIALAAFLEFTYLSQFIGGHSLWINLIIVLFLTLLFKFSPPTKVPWRVALSSSIITCIFLVGAQSLYLQAMKNLFKHNIYYGPIAAIPVSLLWIYCIWVLILFGLTLIRATLEHKLH